MSDDIRVCTDEDEERGNDDIVVCKDEDTESPDDIKHCTDKRGDECAEPPELLMTGTTTPIVGSQYTVIGGVSPYSFSFGAGSISTAGVITSIDDCGSPGSQRWSTVSVRDGCQQTTSIEVRLAGGNWVAIAVNSCSFNDAVQTPGQCVPSGASCTSPLEIRGGLRYEEKWSFGTGAGCEMSSCFQTFSEPCFGGQNYCTTQTVAEWQC